MPRLPRLEAVGVPQHIIQRGNNRQLCFGSNEDFAAYAAWLKEYSRKYEVDIHAWVFMTNHVHLLATANRQHGVSQMMQSLGRRYVQYFNYQYRRTGTLWEGRFRSCLVESERYLLECYRYIELNPVRAGMVKPPADYQWSSHRTNAFGITSGLVTPHRVYSRLGTTLESRLRAYRGFFAGQIDHCFIQKLRLSTQKGMVIGSDRFKEQLSKLHSRKVDNLRRGRPAKTVLEKGL